MLFAHETAVVVELLQAPLRESVPLVVAVKLNVGVWLVVFVTVHPVMIGILVFR